MLTELEAINAMLGTIRESPVSSLADPLPEEALQARNVLEEISKDVQRIGWAFNIEEDVTLTKDGDGAVTLPSNALRIDVDPATISDSHDPVARGPTLFNRGTNTYVFTQNVLCRRLYRYLDWELLPDTARRYVSMRAARVFSNRVSGSPKVEQDASIEEQRSMRELRREHGRAERPNILNAPGIHQLAWRTSSWL
jgi:hypothetical protein